MSHDNGDGMQALRSIPLPTPKLRGRKLVQAKIETGLRDAVFSEAKKMDIDIRVIVDYGLRHWLLMVAPKEAAKLGIFPKEEKK